MNLAETKIVLTQDVSRLVPPLWEGVAFTYLTFSTFEVAPMACSPAQMTANRQNAQRSTGPKTPEGKARSRENAIKHGLTGAGVALPTEDREEVAGRFVAIQEEMSPSTVVGMHLAHRIALMTVRCQRAARQETAALTAKILRAPAEWDEARAAEADHLMGWIGVEPVAYRRQLVSTPEGIDRLIAALLGLKSELDQAVVVWDYNHYTKLEAYTGRREFDLPESRGMKLSKALKGDFSALLASDYAHLRTEDERRNWACDELIGYIQAEIAKLEALRAEINHEALARDRAESVERAQFDPGKEATLARKYEAAASREFYRALREFRAVEAEGEPAPDFPTEEAAPIEAGDRVEIAEVGLIPDAPKPIPKTDLERTLGSFGTLIRKSAKGDPRGTEPPIRAGRGQLIPPSRRR